MGMIWMEETVGFMDLSNGIYPGFNIFVCQFPNGHFHEQRKPDIRNPRAGDPVIFRNMHRRRLQAVSDKPVLAVCRTSGYCPDVMLRMVWQNGDPVRFWPAPPEENGVYVYFTGVFAC